METELDIIEALNSFSYVGRCTQNDVLTRALENGPKSAEFQELVSWLAHELHILCKTDETVSAGVDASEFAMELSSMLKELGCPYTQFVTGPLSERFESRKSCMLLLEYLITELMAIKMSLRRRPAAQQYIISKNETDTARALDQLMRDLCVEKPTANVAPKAFFDKLNFKVEEKQRQAKSGVLCEPLMRSVQPLTDAEWEQLEAIHADLDAEYDMRRQMLLTRLEVTVQSFQWSDRMQTRENEIISRFQDKLKSLEALKHGGDDTNIVALLAARSDLAIIEKTSSVKVRKNTGSKIQKHIIGSVPDRGGRANEHAPPPPEMPSWQQQRAGAPPRGGGGRGGGRGGGGRGGGGGGGNWQPSFTVPPEQQRPQFQQGGRGGGGGGGEQNWMEGSGRVQGTGWSQRGNEYDRDGGGGYRGEGRGRGGRGGGNYRGRGGGGNYNNNSNNRR